MRPDLFSKTVLITGATTGIGLALLQRLLKGSWRIIATARPTSMPRFRELGFQESDTLRLHPLDILNAEQREELHKGLVQEDWLPGILINNAGLSYRGVVEQMDSVADEQQMRINCLAPLALTRLFLPSMRERRAGRILNISSVGGMMAMPTMGSYSASKFALEGASESLWYEMRPWGVHVTLVQPGFVRSESFRNVRPSRQAEQAQLDERDPYHRYYRHMVPFIERLMWQSRSSAEDVARRIEGVMRMKRPPLRVAGTKDARFFYMLRRLLPRTLYHNLLYRNLPEIGDWGPA